MRPQLQTADALAASASQAAQRASGALLARQNEQGYWWAYLTADTTLESDYILLQLWLDPPQDGVWQPKNRELIDKAVRSILRR
jgi:squalene-hopene/tetraprenyl-beta-curcumene cyclase